MMIDMSPEQMREVLKDYYMSDHIRNKRIDDMSDNQIAAIYKRLMNARKL